MLLLVLGAQFMQHTDSLPYVLSMQKSALMVPVVMFVFNQPILCCM